MIYWNPFLIRILLAFLLIHLELKRQIRSYSPVVPSKTIPDSRLKWRKSIPVFRPKRRKTLLFGGGEGHIRLYDLRDTMEYSDPTFNFLVTNFWLICQPKFALRISIRKINKLPCKWKVDFGIGFEIQSIFAFFFIVMAMSSLKWLKELFCVMSGAIVAM